MNFFFKNRKSTSTWLRSIQHYREWKRKPQSIFLTTYHDRFFQNLKKYFYAIFIKELCIILILQPKNEGKCFEYWHASRCKVHFRNGLGQQLWWPKWTWPIYLMYSPYIGALKFTDGKNFARAYRARFSFFSKIENRPLHGSNRWIIIMNQKYTPWRFFEAITVDIQYSQPFPSFFWL